MILSLIECTLWISFELPVLWNVVSFLILHWSRKKFPLSQEPASLILQAWTYKLPLVLDAWPPCPRCSSRGLVKMLIVSSMWLCFQNRSKLWEARVRPFSQYRLISLLDEVVWSEFRRLKCWFISRLVGMYRKWKVGSAESCKVSSGQVEARMGGGESKREKWRTGLTPK